MGKRSREKRESRAVAAPAATPQDSGRRTQDSRVWIAALLIALATIAIYAHVAGDQFVNFDDPLYVQNNAHVLKGLTPSNFVWAFTSTTAANWHPLTMLSLMLDVTLFGADAGKIALVNVLLHVVNSILLLFVLFRATRRFWPSTIVAALFALHPLHVESVAWVSERKDVLSTLFFLLAIFFYLGGRRWIATLAFAIGLLAKPMIITLPFVLILLDWWPLDRWSPRAWPKLKTSIIEKWPMFLLVLGAAVATIGAQQEAMSGGKVALTVRLANGVLSYVEYLGKTIWPLHLAIFYPYRTAISIGAVVAALALLIAITIAVFRFADRFPYLPVGWLWYLGTLVPVIGIVQVGRQAMADRYTYIPHIGLFIAVVWLLADVVRVRAALAAAASIALLGCAALTYLQAGFWRDSMTLFAHAIEVAPNGITSRTNLGASYLEKLDFNAAAEQYRAAVAASPSDPTAHTGLGLALSGLGDPAGARREFAEAMRLDPKAPEPYRGLARLELGSGRADAAIPLLQKSIALAPDDESTQGMLATAQGKLDDAIAHYRKAVEQKPDSAEGHNDLGAVLAKRGDDAGALAEYETALRIAPASYDTIMNAGALLSRMNRDADATAKFADAARLRPRSPEPHVYLALIYSQDGRLQDAIGEVRNAAAIDAELANVQFTNAVHIPFKPTNLAEFLGALEQKAAGRG